MEIGNSHNHLKVLMQLAKSGNTEAFGRLYEIYFVPVFRYIYYRIKNREETEDLVQTVFLKAYRSIPNFEEQNKSPLAYFFTIARNAVIDYWRARKNNRSGDPEQIFEQIADNRTNPTDAVEKEGVKKILHRAIAQLTEDQREVVTLKFINGMSNKEIAGLLEKTEEAVRQLQCRGLKTLRQILKKENIL